MRIQMPSSLQMCKIFEKNFFSHFSGGHLDVVRLLVEYSADVDSQDNRKVSCLMASFKKVSSMSGIFPSKLL